MTTTPRRPRRYAATTRVPSESSAYGAMLTEYAISASAGCRRVSPTAPARVHSETSARLPIPVRKLSHHTTAASAAATVADRTARGMLTASDATDRT